MQHNTTLMATLPFCFITKLSSRSGDASPDVGIFLYKQDVCWAKNWVTVQIGGKH